MLEGASRVYHAGMELLGTRRLSRRSLRLGMRRIIGDNVSQMPQPVDESTGREPVDEHETPAQKEVGRAPPLPVTVES